MSVGLQVTLTPEIAAIIMREAARKGTSADVVTNDVIRERFAVAGQQSGDNDSEAPPSGTLLDRFSKHIGTIDTGGANLSVDTGKRFADLLVEKYRPKQSP